MDSKDMLYALIFNKYRENIIDTSYINMTIDSYLDKILDKTTERREDLLYYGLIRKYLMETKPVDTYQEIIDIIQVSDPQLKRKYSTIFEAGYLEDKLEKKIKTKLLKEDSLYSYFDSRKVYGENDKIAKIENIDYLINLETYDNYYFALQLVQICQFNNIPYLFQLSKNNKVVIIKTDEEHLNIYNEIIKTQEDNIKEINITKLKKEKVEEQETKKPFQFIKRLIKK